MLVAECLGRRPRCSAPVPVVLYTGSVARCASDWGGVCDSRAACFYCVDVVCDRSSRYGNDSRTIWLRFSSRTVWFRYGMNGVIQARHSFVFRFEIAWRPFVSPVACNHAGSHGFSCGVDAWLFVWRVFFFPRDIGSRMKPCFTGDLTASCPTRLFLLSVLLFVR